MKIMSEREYKKTKDLAHNSLLIALMVFATAFELESKFMAVIGILISLVWFYDARRYFREIKEDKRRRKINKYR